jgi:hypothetical protein
VVAVVRTSYDIRFLDTWYFNGTNDETGAMTAGRKCLFKSQSSILFDISLFKIIYAQSGILVCHQIISTAVPSHLLYCQRHGLTSAIGTFHSSDQIKDINMPTKHLFVPKMNFWDTVSSQLPDRLFFYTAR